jgi:hypothetical protein
MGDSKNTEWGIMGMVYMHSIQGAGKAVGGSIGSPISHDGSMQEFVRLLYGSQARASISFFIW